MSKVSDSSFAMMEFLTQKLRALGLRTIGQDLLKQHQLSIPFGQKEKLVDRINRILEGYPFSEDILKEMLQNADDSGATVINFIKDYRHLPKERLFDNRWEPLQGPALSIYNNKSFTESRFKRNSKPGKR